MARPQEQKDFELYQKNKFDSWKTRKQTFNQNPQTDNRTEEQKAYESYALEMGDFVLKEYVTINDLDNNTQPSSGVTEGMRDRGIGTGKIKDIKTGYYYIKSSTIGLPPILKTGAISGASYLGIVFISKGSSFGNNSQDCAIETIYVYNHTTQSGKIFHRAKPKDRVWTEWADITSSGGNVIVPTFDNDCVATATSVPSTEQPSVTVTLKKRPETQEGTNNRQFNFDFKIPKGADGASGGGGGGTQPITPTVPVEPKNAKLATVEGAYAVNLFNYREMSRDRNFSVNSREFSTKKPHQLITDPKELKKLTPYNRIRESQKFWYSLKKSHAPHQDHGHDDIRAKIHAFNHSDILTSLEINPLSLHYDTVHEATEFQNAGYGYLRFDIGGNKKPVEGGMEIDAWYGTSKDFRPNDLRQDFRFKEYNGFTLRANHTGVKDEYVHSRWGDFIDIKLNVLDLKDAELMKASDNPIANTTTLYIKCPKDFWYPAVGDEAVSEHTIKNKLLLMQKNLMTNNLCDITSDDVTGAEEDKPFFVKAITEVPKTNPVTKETIQYKCFQIEIGRENKSRWKEHLMQTQIMYLVKDPEIIKEYTFFTPLPLGGMIYTLNSGQSIETNKYGKITNFNLKQHKTRGIKFSDSPFGYPDMVIDSDSIASVVLTPLPDDFNK